MMLLLDPAAAELGVWKTEDLLKDLTTAILNPLPSILGYF
jgi:hypothetical protein